MTMGAGLSLVSTVELVRLLRALNKGELLCPPTHPNLLRAGLPGLVDKVDHLKGLDARAVHAVLVAVIAERRAVEARAQKAPPPLNESDD